MDNIGVILEGLKSSLESFSDTAKLSATNAQLQFETMAELQKDERESIRKHYEAIIQRYTRIIFGLILALVILIGGIIGSAIYIFTNFDLAFSTYQEMDIGGDGNQNVYDGIHMNTRE